MDDLAGLDWSATSSTIPGKSSTTSTGNYYPSLRPTPPLSGRSTPSFNPNGAAQPRNPPSSNAPAKPSTAPGDSFANLLPFSSSQASKNLSLQDQQKLLEEQKRKQEVEKQKQHTTFLAPSAWDTLGNGRPTPDRVTSPPTYAATNEYGGQKLSSAINKPFAALGGKPPAPQSSRSDRNPTKNQPDLLERDLLAAFDADTPVDSSSNFPVSADVAFSNGTASVPQAWAGGDGQAFEDDDDPFGLGMAPLAGSSKPPIAPYNEIDDDDDDVLGLLGKPVSELPPRKLESAFPVAIHLTDTSEPMDGAIAELVDMGFSLEKSKEALAVTESGLDVQAAVGWLLNQAHEQSRSKTNTAAIRGRQSETEGEEQLRRRPNRTDSPDTGTALPAWMRQQSRGSSTQRREDSKSPVNSEKDAAKIAAELGTNLFKTANSLWKTGTKKLNQAVSEFNSDSDTSQPKWMKETPGGQAAKPSEPRGKSNVDFDNAQIPRRTGRPIPAIVAPDMTDEAMMLESGNSRPGPRQRAQQAEPKGIYSQDSSRDQSPVHSSTPHHTQRTESKFMQYPTLVQPRSKLSRHMIEEENLTAYVSPARRKTTVPKPPIEADLLFHDSPDATPLPSKPAPMHKPQSKPKPKSKTTTTPPPQPQPPSRPPPPKRTFPHPSPSALQSSTTHRKAGSASFKLGNYADATTSYTTALSSLPPTHPLTIPLLTNRALTHLKTGNPKASIEDADAALALIGPSRGSNESIDLGDPEGSKPMAPFWAKALMRKAEALEQLERFADAAHAWTACVEAGVGGKASIEARTRTQIAAGSKPKPKAAPAPPNLNPNPNQQSFTFTSKSKSTHSSSPPPPTATATATATAALTRLRALNTATTRLDDEKFALADRVHDRLALWRQGKEGNLRALLASLESVLWEGAGWTRVGMGELIVPGRVKVVYFRGVGRVHPDKLPTTATTEQIMISQAVFSTLNEAWERFKAENGL